MCYGMGHCDKNGVMIKSRIPHEVIVIMIADYKKPNANIVIFAPWYSVFLPFPRFSIGSKIAFKSLAIINVIRPISRCHVCRRKLEKSRQLFTSGNGCPEIKTA